MIKVTVNTHIEEPVSQVHNLNMFMQRAFAHSRSQSTRPAMASMWPQSAKCPSDKQGKLLLLARLQGTQNHYDLPVNLHSIFGCSWFLQPQVHILSKSFVPRC